jgi:small GTP-binding protein
MLNSTLCESRFSVKEMRSTVDQERSEHLESLLQAMRRRLRIMEIQRAQMGLETRPEVVIEIEDLRQNISDVEGQLDIIYVQDREDRKHLNLLLQEHRRRLYELEKYRATMGLDTNPSIILEIEDIQEAILGVKNQLDIILTDAQTQGELDAIALRQTLTTHFNDEELRVLSFDLNIDYDDLGDIDIEDKARELVIYCLRSERITALVTTSRRMRPNVIWPNVGQPEPLPIEAIEVLAEAKLILVGDGNVGKTSLVNRLVYDSFNQLESITRGVAITHWYIDLPHADVQQARMNIWDFGGQGNMHATHPYFFSRRAVYLVVLNVREDDRANRVEYWLRLIRTYGTDSPVIVVSNKIDQYPARLDQRMLAGKYPNIFEFVRTSCETGDGISELRAIIARAVCTFEDIGVRTLHSLVKLKQTLESMTDARAVHIRDTLSLDEYEDLCEQHGVDPDHRAGFLRRLNDLGVVLYFGDDARLELNAVLNPYWVTEGIYRIINHESSIAFGGKMQLEQIRAILPRDRYASEKSMYILDMMRKFELCFALDEQQTLFLLPDLLPPQQPELPFFDRENALKLQFEYPVWQGTTLTRLLVRLNHYLVENAYWRNGALLQSLDGKNRAFVIADETDRRLRIWVDGELVTRRNLLNRIREELNVIHGNQRDQVVKEWVITAEMGEVPYQLLVNLEAKGTETHDVLIGNELVELNVKELLNGVRAEVMPDSYRLKELIVERLSLDELDDLCFKFKISLEDIEGQMTKDAKARNLIRQFERTRRMPELMSVLRDLRKNMTWA